MTIKSYSCQVISNQKLDHKFLCLRAKVKNRNFTFKSGQFIILKITPTVFRDYSISTTPNKLPFWETVVDISPAGPGSQFIQKLKPGDTFEIIGPAGVFTLKPPLPQNLVFVVTGSGISSIKSLIEHLLEQKTPKNLFLFWGLRYQQDLFYQDLLKNWAKHKNFKYQILLSRPPKNFKGKKGHVTQPVLSLLEKLSPSDTQLYLCGNSGMIDNINQAAQITGLASSHIRFEKYYQDAKKH